MDLDSKARWELAHKRGLIGNYAQAVEKPIDFWLWKGKADGESKPTESKA